MFRLNPVQRTTQLFSFRSARVVSTILVMSVIVMAGETPAGETDADQQRLTLPRDLRRFALSDFMTDELAESVSEDLQILFDDDGDLDDREKAVEDLRVHLQDPSLSEIRSSLRRRVDLVSAGLRAARLEHLSDDTRKAVGELISAVIRYEDTSVSADAEEVREVWRKLNDNSDVMSLIRPVLMDQYFNYNVHITVSEQLLARLIQDYRTDNGTIAECILGAWVTGQQSTQANVTADIKRSTTHAHFVVKLNGQTNSSTRGRRKPATIFTRGNHFFNIVSPVYFDGRSMTSGGSTMHVNTNNRTVGVQTDLDWIPIIGHVARKIAWKKALESRGRSESIAAQKLAGRALPEFERELNQKFADANTSIRNELLGGLDRKGVGPDSISSRSSETHLAVSSRTIGTSRLGGSPQPFAPLPPTGLGFQIHESAVNNVIDGLELNGRSIREDEFTSVMEESLSDLFQREIRLRELTRDSVTSLPEVLAPGALTDPANVSVEGGEDDSPKTFVFDKDDPVRMRFERDGIVLVLRMGVEEEGREPIPPQRIEIPVAVSLQGGKIVLTPPEKRTDINVGALEPTPRLRQIGRARQIQRIIQEELPERKIDGQLSLEASETKTILLNTVHVKVADGWVYVELQ